MVDGKLHGKNGSIRINHVKVSDKTEWSLNMARDYADVSTFRDRNKVYAAGLKDISGTFAGLLDVDYDLAFQSNTGESVLVSLYADDGHLVAEGPAYVDVSVTVSVSDAVRCSGNFKAAGAW
jgi:hypothetical protein